MSKSGCFYTVGLRLTFFPLIDQLFQRKLERCSKLNIYFTTRKKKLLFYHVLLLILNTATKSENHIQLQNVT